MTSPWNLTDHDAVLAEERWRGSVDLLRPNWGMRLAWSAAPSAAVPTVLAVMLPSSEPSGGCPLVEHYLRSADLVTAYGEAPHWPLRTDIVWRALAAVPNGMPLGGVELIVAVRTALLDSQPTLSVTSRLPTAVLLMGDDGAFHAPPPAATAAELPASGCLVARADDCALSYVEMVHPSDFCRSALTPATDGGWEVRHRLFPAALEKGVILQARLRGMLVARQDDLRCAAQLYQAFAASEPPLETF